MTEEGLSGESSPVQPTTRKAGWYRDRKTGQRRFWNGVAWTRLSDVVTPFTVEPQPEPEPAATPTAPPSGAEKKSIDSRTKLIAASVAVVVLILGIVAAVELSNTGTTRVSTNQTAPATALPSDTSVVTTPVEATTSPLGSGITTTPLTTVTSSPAVTGPGVTSPPATSLDVPNPAGNVAIVGDSITYLARTDLAHALRHYNLYIDAVDKTTMAEHLQKIEQLASDGQPRDWVIELGTNDALPEPSNPNWATDFANEAAALQNQRCVVFLTVNPRLGSIATGINGAIADAVATHSNFHSIDWGDIEFRKSQWLQSDGIHPTKAGDVELAKLEHQAIRGCQGQ